MMEGGGCRKCEGKGGEGEREGWRERWRGREGGVERERGRGGRREGGVEREREGWKERGRREGKMWREWGSGDVCGGRVDLLVSPELLQFVGVGHSGRVVTPWQYSDIGD